MVVVYILYMEYWIWGIFRFFIRFLVIGFVWVGIIGDEGGRVYDK